MLKAIRINTIMCQLVVQMTQKLCTDLQDKNSRESTYGKLSCFDTYISNVYNLTQNPVNGLIEYYRYISMVTPTEYRLVYLMLIDNIFEQNSDRVKW